MTLIAWPEHADLKAVRLEVINRFEPGTLEVRFQLPEGVQTPQESGLTQTRMLLLNERTEFILPLIFSEQGSYRVDAQVSVRAFSGSEVSTSAFLLIGAPRRTKSSGEIFSATAADGRALRVHRVQAHPEQSGRQP